MTVSTPGHCYSLTKISSNAKLGPISCTMTSRDSCPPTCSFSGGNGCYAESGNVRIHWGRLDHTGLTLDQLCEGLRKLPKRQKIRFNVAGDLPQVGGVICTSSLERIVDASVRLDPFTYTHADPLDFTNHDSILAANKSGFTVNLSAESLIEADLYADLGIAPVVVAVPRGTPKVTHTTKGRQVTMCPAVYSDMTCDRCMICAKSERKSIVAFEAHGTSAARVERIFWARSAT